ncbi:MAG: sulfatase [Myxococcota bacterium]
MSQLKGLITALAALFVLIGITQMLPLGSPDPRAPNVLFILVDTLRADHISAYGYPRETSPAIDALALESVVFSDAISQAPVTIPSVLQIMTGQLLIGKSIPSSTPTLAQALRSAGYATMAIVDNPILESRPTGIELGFDSFFTNAVIDERLDQQHYKTKTPADVITQRAIRWLESHPDSRPFFAWLHYFDPHDPYTPPYPQDSPFLPASESGLPESVRIGDIRRNPLATQRRPPDAPTISAGERARLIDLYDSEIRYLDGSLEDLFDHLKRADLYDETLIVLTSDHGEAFGEHGEWMHGRSLHRNQLHVPLLIKLPEPETQHRQVDTPVQLIDLAPTLCAYLRIHCSSTGNDRNILEHSYAEAFTLWNFWIAVRDESWKLIYHISTQQAQLYDLASDPTEQHNRAQSDPETLARLLAKKDELLEASWKHQEAALQQSAEQAEQLRELGYLQ